MKASVFYGWAAFPGSHERKSWPSALGGLLLTILLGILPYGCASPGSMRHPGTSGLPVLFTLEAPYASKVCVVGDFNQWSSHVHCMTRSESTWSLSLRLPPGRYQYAFLIDGKTWQVDPGATLVQDSGFGTKNALLIIE